MEKYEIVKYKHNEVELNINVSLNNQNAWLSLNDMCLLYDRDKSVISRHIKNILQNDSINNDSLVAKKATTQSVIKESLVTAPDGKNYKTKLYNLEIVLMVGQRVRSQNGLLLKEFIEDYLKEQTLNLQSAIIIYNNGKIHLPVNVSPEEDTVWLNQSQIADLFETTISNITMHIKNIISDGEICSEDSSVDGRTVKKSLIDVGTYFKRMSYDVGDGRQYNVLFYNLDMILAVGYRVKSKRAIEFRRWASSVLKQYLLKGYVISPERALVTKENYEELVLDVHNLKKDVNEIKEVLGEKVINPYICYEGQYYDGFIFINDLIKSAKKSVVIIDGYADDTVFKFFKGSKKEIKKTIICHKADRISQESLDTFIKQYGGVSILENKSFHDRFLVIDSNVYMIGSSLNSIGNKTTVVIRVQDFVLDDLLQTKTQP